MKTLLSVAFILVVPALVKAQTADVHFGIKAGVNVASMDVKDGVDFDSKVGLNLGALAHVHLSPHFAVQPEVVYSQQGGKDGNDKWKINYVNIPVLAQYMVGDGFRLETGPQLGLKVASKIKSGDVTVENHDVNTFDFSWALGASYVSTAGLGIDARYNFGLTNVNDADFPEVRNRVFQIGVFYQFSNSMKMHKK